MLCCAEGNGSLLAMHGLEDEVVVVAVVEKEGKGGRVLVRRGEVLCVVCGMAR